jgi:DNA-binding NarL/FixJ family response regulator
MVISSCRMKLGIYLVEDSEIMSTLLRELLEGNGATIVGHSDSAQTAIRDIARVKPDVVVIDVALARGNGFDVLKSLRDDPPAKPPLRVVLTNYTLAAYRKAAKRLGADYFLDKSNQIPQLLRLLRSRYRGMMNGNGTSS